MSEGNEVKAAEGNEDADEESTSEESSATPERDESSAVATKGKGDAKGEPAETPNATPAQWAFLSAIALVTAGLDLWSKAWAVKRLSIPSPRAVPLCVPPPGMPHYQYQRIPNTEVPVLHGWLEFRYAENCGGAWGLLHGASEKLRKPFFLIVTAGAVLFILRLYKTLEPEQKAMRVALPLVLGGALGNLVDRLRLGYVVDFILMHYKEHYWPTYNVADIAITVGIGLMLLEYVVGPGPKKVPAKPALAKQTA